MGQILKMLTEYAYIASEVDKSVSQIPVMKRSNHWVIICGQEDKKEKKITFGSDVNDIILKVFFEVGYKQHTHTTPISSSSSITLYLALSGRVTCVL